MGYCTTVKCAVPHAAFGRAFSCFLNLTNNSRKVNTLRLSPEYLRETARYFRYLMDELDYTRWRIDASWIRLDTGWQGFSSGVAENGYETTTTLTRQLADIFYRCAWELETAAARIEEADVRAASDFDGLMQMLTTQ